MVCLGNICRSPIAEGVLKHKFQQKNIEAIVDSAATGSWHVGEQPDYRAYSVSKKNGIDISQQKGRQIDKKDFDKYDRIFVMDREIRDNVMKVARNNEDKRKVDYLMNVLDKDSNRPVPDPYFGGQEGFENVFAMIDEACEKICEMIVSGELNKQQSDKSES